MDRIKRIAALACIRGANMLTDVALWLTPRPVPVVLLDDMDDDMGRAMREADLLGRALRGVVG